MPSLTSIDIIRKQLNDLKDNKIVGLYVEPEKDDDLYYCNGCIEGPESSPYAGGVFFFKLEFPNDYPLKPFKIQFTTKIYHPNITSDGEVSLEILRTDWNPFWTISKVLSSLITLISNPDPIFHVNPEIAQVYKMNRDLYKLNAKKWTVLYA